MSAVDAAGFPLRRQSSIHINTNQNGLVIVANVACTYTSSGALATDTTEIPAFVDQIGNTADASWLTLQTTTTLRSTAHIVMSACSMGALETNFDSWFEIKTPVSLIDLMLFVGFGFTASTDGHPENTPLCGLRYLSSTTDALANDAGWTIVLQSDTNGGNNQFTYPLGAIAASTQYLIRIQSKFDGMSGGGSPTPVGNVTFTLNGVSHSVSFADTINLSGTYPTNYAMPTGSHQANRMRPYVGVVQKQASAAIRKFNVRRFCVTSD